MDFICVHSGWGFHGANDDFFLVHIIKKHMCVVSFLTLSLLWLLAVILCPFLCWGCLMFLYIACLLCRLRCMHTISNLSCYKINFLLWANKKGDVIGNPKLKWWLSWPYHCSNLWYCLRWMIKLLSSCVGLQWVNELFS